MRRTVRGALIAVVGCLVVFVVAPAGSPVALAPDTAEVYGIDTASKPIELVYGVHGYLKLRGMIDESRAGAQGLTVLVHPVDNSSGQAACPSPAPKATGLFDDFLAVGSPFDVAYASGVWTLAHNVRFCFYFVHHDGSQTQSSQDVTFRDPVDKVVVNVANVIPKASRRVTVTLGGESDHQYSGQLRVHPAAKPCQRTYASETGVEGDIPNPFGVRYWSRFYGRSKTKGPTLNLSTLARGTYRVCAWIGPANNPVSRASTTFKIQ